MRKIVSVALMSILLVGMASAGMVISDDDYGDVHRGETTKNARLGFQGYNPDCLTNPDTCDRFYDVTFFTSFQLKPIEPDPMTLEHHKTIRTNITLTVPMNSSLGMNYATICVIEPPQGIFTVQYCHELKYNVVEDECDRKCERINRRIARYEQLIEKYLAKIEYLKVQLGGRN